jgi:hypothetical protein
VSPPDPRRISSGRYLTQFRVIFYREEPIMEFLVEFDAI